jgi:hypothetical protein
MTCLRVSRAAWKVSSSKGVSQVQQRVSHYIVLQECPTKVPSTEYCKTEKVWKKIQECRARVSAKTGAGTLFFNVMENNEGGCISRVIWICMQRFCSKIWLNYVAEDAVWDMVKAWKCFRKFATLTSALALTLLVRQSKIWSWNGGKLTSGSGVAQGPWQWPEDPFDIFDAMTSGCPRVVFALQVVQ